MIAREQRRLGTVFRRLLLLSLAAPGAVEACSTSSGGPGGGPADASAAPDAPQSVPDAAEANSPVDAAQGDDAADAAALPDGAGEACAPSAPYQTDASFTAFPDSGPDAQLYACYYFVDLPCGTTAAHGTGSTACYFYLTECASLCTGQSFVDCLYADGKGCLDGSVTVEAGEPATIACGTCNGVGRKPAGLRRPAASPSTTDVARYLEATAHLEAASVFAFRRLERELANHRAPLGLVRAAARAARDEERHARVAGRLALQFGGAPRAARVRPDRPRSFEAMARENAVEGCVRETFGAMVATWQATYAGDARVRRAMKRIARDEVRHAALAWAVARWADSRLTPRARARVARARAGAVGELGRELVGARHAPHLARAIGLPDSREQESLFGGLVRAIWPDGHQRDHLGGKRGSRKS